MLRDNREKPDVNYQTALNSLYAHYGRKDLMFADITAVEIRKWTKTLEKTAMAKRN